LTLAQNFAVGFGNCVRFFDPFHTHLKRRQSRANRLMMIATGDLFRLIWCAVVGPFRSRAGLQTEILKDYFWLSSKSPLS
jgi:hypothetical protein